MNNAKDVLLCSTLHDPRGVFLDRLRNASNVVLKNYRGWVINVTTTTDKRVKDVLRALAPLGVSMTETDLDHPVVLDKIENDHVYLLKQTVGIAKELGVRKVQYTDGDRIITAATYYPQDLQRIAERASKFLGDKGSYVNFRRSAEDYISHHPPLVQTELEFNRLYSEVFGMPIDIGSTMHGMSVDIVEEIINRSPQMESISFPHPKWIIIAKEMGAQIRSEETKNVLTFETPDQFRKEIEEKVVEGKLSESLRTEDLEEYPILQQVYMTTLGLDSTVSQREWALRFNTESQYLELLRNHLSVFGYSEKKESELDREINSSLRLMEGRRDAINEALGRSKEKVHKMTIGRAENVLNSDLNNYEKVRKL